MLRKTTQNRSETTYNNDINLHNTRTFWKYWAWLTYDAGIAMNKFYNTVTAFINAFHCRPNRKFLAALSTTVLLHT